MGTQWILLQNGTVNYMYKQFIKDNPTNADEGQIKIIE